jgi:hypothetical protein
MFMSSEMINPALDRCLYYSTVDYETSPLMFERLRVMGAMDILFLRFKDPISID